MKPETLIRRYSFKNHLAQSYKCGKSGFVLDVAPVYPPFLSRPVSPGPRGSARHRHQRQPGTAAPVAAGAAQPAVPALPRALHRPRPLLGQRRAATAPVLPRPTPRRQLRPPPVPAGLHPHMERR